MRGRRDQQHGEPARSVEPAAEPLVDELSLVSPALRDVTVAASAEVPWRIYTPLAPQGPVAPPQPPDIPRLRPRHKQTSLVGGTVTYAAWQVFVGAVFGIGVIVALAVGVMLLSLIHR
jgi:hypothetical protein